ncbi:transporter substrate-binding domain-containing protein [Corynebacterium flavescens]|uniref:transporter substrate-binding domain-containing protein n=1 Tax=Corynebacterium flavescens TaxID=28028 RepID=UPI000EB930A2|nr:amino acid ABC transporter substrate-binding protein [Corynebacterium flavescens]
MNVLGIGSRKARTGAEGNRKRLGVVAGIVAALSLTLAACSSGSSETASESPAADASQVGRTVDEIKESGSVRIGVFADKAPFGSIDQSGNYAGYDIVYGDRIGKDLGVDVEYVPVEAASRVEFLESGKVDIILANFTVTPERQEKVDFANPYMKVSLGVASPEDAPITKPEQLKDSKLVIVKGTTADSYLAANYPDADVQKFEQYTEVTNSLLDGRADGWVTDNTEALAWTGAQKGFTTGIASLGDEDTIAAAVAKGNTQLREWLNQQLTDLAGEQFFHKDFDETLRPVYGDNISADELVVEGGKLS